MRLEVGVKWLPVSRVIELLSQLPSDARLAPNSLGNIVVLSPVGDGCAEYVEVSGAYAGYVDFDGDGAVRLWRGG